jgi:cytidine deaminase
MRYLYHRRGVCARCPRSCYSLHMVERMRATPQVGREVLRVHLTPEEDTLLREAEQAITAENENGKLHIGASALGEGGTIFTTQNNKELHAEMRALWGLYSKMRSLGLPPRLRMIAIAGEEGAVIPKPCGRCRDRLLRNTANISHSNKDVVWVLVKTAPHKVWKVKLHELLPEPFDGTVQDIEHYLSLLHNNTTHDNDED